MRLPNAGSPVTHSTFDQKLPARGHKASRPRAKSRPMVIGRPSENIRSHHHGKRQVSQRGPVKVRRALQEIPDSLPWFGRLSLGARRPIRDSPDQWDQKEGRGLREMSTRYQRQRWTAIGSSCFARQPGADLKCASRRLHGHAFSGRFASEHRMNAPARSGLKRWVDRRVASPGHWSVDPGLVGAR